jgi:hypothetical protein
VGWGGEFGKGMWGGGQRDRMSNQQHRWLNNMMGGDRGRQKADKQEDDPGHCLAQQGKHWEIQLRPTRPCLTTAHTHM